MSNVVLFEKGQRPSYALEKQAPSVLTDTLGGSGGGFPKRISIRGSVFRLIADGKEVSALEQRHLDVVIVRAAPAIGRKFFAGTYDEEKSAPPDCWSADGITPDAASAHRQSSGCASCPQNIKGSGNEESRACRFTQQIAVVLANDQEGDVLQLALPAKSLFGKEDGDNRPLQAYKQFCASGNAHVEQLITRMKFDTNSSTPKLFFKAMRWLTEEEAEIAKAKGLSDEAERAVTMTVSAHVAPPVFAGLPPKLVAKPVAIAPPPPVEEEEPPPPPPKAAVKKAAVKKAAPVAAAPAEEEEPPAPAPVVREKAAVATPLKRPDISKVVAEWGDDDDEAA